MSRAAHKNSRWYDEYPPVIRSIELMESLPHPHRQFVARALNDYTVDHRLLGSGEELKSLGPQKVLGLIQSKLKRRWYDKDPVFHKAINNILLMDEENRRNMAYRMVVSLEALETYRESCESQGLLADHEEMMQIVLDIFARNINELLQLTSGQQPQRTITTEETDHTADQVTSDDSGMRVSHFFDMP